MNTYHGGGDATCVLIGHLSRSRFQASFVILANDTEDIALRHSPNDCETSPFQGAEHAGIIGGLSV